MPKILSLLKKLWYAFFYLTLFDFCTKIKIMTRGGKRTGAGRPKNTGKFGGKTCAIRVPESLVPEIKALVEGEGYSLPLYSSKVQAGTPSPADDHVDQRIDLNQHLVKHPATTFFVRVTGESMLNAGMYEDDILVVDRSLEARPGKIVIAAVDGELTVKRLHHTKTGEVMLLPENDAFAPIRITEETEFSIWGVVTNVIHPV